MTRFSSAFALPLVGIAVASACGSSESTAPASPGDASAGSATTGADGATGGIGGRAGGGPLSDGAPAIGDLLDGLAIPDGPIGDCVHCLVGKCGAAIGACMMNPSCQAGLTCTLVNCLKPTGLDFACVAPCFAGDITSGLTALSGIMCLQTNCAATCGALVEAGTPNDGAARAQGDASATRDVTESGAPFDAASDSAAE